MCKECQDSLDKYFPHLTQQEKNDLLWSATCFPFGSAAPQLREMHDAGIRTLDEALSFAKRAAREGKTT